MAGMGEASQSCKLGTEFDFSRFEPMSKSRHQCIIVGSIITIDGDELPFLMSDTDIQK
jgi:hypothetical protein